MPLAGYDLCGRHCQHNRESPLSFCNGLGTIYIASFRGRTLLILPSKILVGSLGTVLGRCKAPKTAQPKGWHPLIVS